MSEKENSTNNISIDLCIKTNLDHYFSALEGMPITGVYDLVLGEVEKSLISYVLDFCQGNQTSAAKVLGISRNSLRNRIDKYSL